MITDYRSIFEEASDAMIISDGESGKIIDVNKSVCTLLNYQKDELLKLSISDLFLDDGNQDDINDKSFMYGPVINSRKTRKSDGKILQTDITINTINHSDRICILTTLRDATARIEVETELKQLNDTKDKFFSIIAHDLKNPLMALTGYSEILDEEFNELQPEDVLQYIKSIKKLSGNLSKLIENLLNWARVQTEKISFEPEVLKIRPIVENIISLCQPAIDQKFIKVSNEIKPDTEMFCDWNMINTILRNLVGNAIKFTGENGSVSISNGTEENFQVIYIKDSGVGMNDQELDKLFKLDKHFTKQGTNKERGTGLGLLLCKEFIDRHEGDIEVKSEINIGTEFVIKFPVKNEN